MRQFFHINQNGTVAEYIEQFDNLVHQLLAHDGTITYEMLTTRFIDGLKDNIRAVVHVHHPQNLDTASSLALLQEDVMFQLKRREGRRNESSYFQHSQNRSSPLPLPVPPVNTSQPRQFAPVHQ